MSSRLQRKYNNWKKLPGEFPNGDKIQLFLSIAFLVVWIGDSSLEGTTWLNQFIPLGVRLSLGFLCIIISHLLFRQSERDLFFKTCPYNEPVQSGIYQYCRHPMYLGVMLTHIGLGLISLSLIGWILILVTIKFYNILANYEEKKLNEQFGIKQEIYMENVPRWIPNIKKIFYQHQFHKKLEAKYKLRFNS